MLVCCERWKLEKKAKDENEDYYLPFSEILLFSLCNNFVVLFIFT